MKLLIIAAILLLSAQHLHADGGSVVASGESNGLIITLFASPVPIHAGPADLSVLLQSRGDGNPVLDAAVSIRVSARGEPETVVTATHAAATNKLLYAATVDIPSSGTWTVQVDVKAGKAIAKMNGTLLVLSEQPAVLTYWPYFLLVPAGILLFWLNQYLKRQRNVGRMHSGGKTEIR